MKMHRSSLNIVEGENNMNTDLECLAARLAQVEDDNYALQADNAAQQAQFARERRRYRLQVALALCCIVGALLISPANRRAFADPGNGLSERVTAVEAKVTVLQSAS